jgi:hypothetical protein
MVRSGILGGNACSWVPRDLSTIVDVCHRSARFQSSGDSKVDDKPEDLWHLATLAVMVFVDYLPQQLRYPFADRVGVLGIPKMSSPEDGPSRRKLAASDCTVRLLAGIFRLSSAIPVVFRSGV